VDKFKSKRVTISNTLAMSEADLSTRVDVGKVTASCVLLDLTGVVAKAIVTNQKSWSCSALESISELSSRWLSAGHVAR
jgi:uncharacterized protein